MTTHYLKQCRPDAEETAYFWKLYHAAQRVEDRWCRNTVPEIAEALAYCSELSREQKLFLLRAWQVLVDDKGGFGRFMGAFDTYVHNVQDPNDNCVAYKPELKRHIEKGYLFNTVEEAYNEARKRIAELEQQLINPLPIGELLQRLEDQTGDPWSEKYLEPRQLCVKLPDTNSKAFWSGIGKTEQFHPETYKRWVKEAIERAGTIAGLKIEVK